MSKYSVEMIDGGIINKADDMICDNEGCPTCGFGGHYTNDIEIELSKGILKISLGEMYSYCIPTCSDIMKIFTTNNDKIKNMTEEEFIIFLKAELNKFPCEEIEMFIGKRI